MTKIDIYSGFLGAGKTTLIKKMIKEAYAGQKLVLIENEFGEIGIDGGFLQEAGIAITEMNSGCICCSLVGDFASALEKVISQYAPDRILIEPSGVGKLSDVVKAVTSVLNDSVQLGDLVTVADAGKCKMYMKNFGEFYNNQIESAGTIVLSRTGDLAPEKLDKCVALIRAHNPEAVLVTTPWEQLTGAQLMQAMDGGASLSAELAHLAEEAHHHHDHDHDEDEHDHDHEGHCCHHHHDHDEDEHDHEGHCCHHHHDHDEDEHDHEGHCCHHHEEHHHHEDDDDCDCCHHHEHEHEHHHDEHCGCGHHHDHEGHHHADEVFTSWGMETHRKFTREEITNALQELGKESYGFVLRAKGYVANADGERWIHFDYVPGEAELRDGGAMVTGRICVIGSKLDESAIAALFGAAE